MTAGLAEREFNCQSKTPPAGLAAGLMSSLSAIVLVAAYATPAVATGRFRS